MIHGNKFIASLAVFISILIMSSCDIYYDAAVTTSSEPVSAQNSKPDESDDGLVVETEDITDAAESGTASAEIEAAGTGNRFFKVSQNKEGQYVLTLFNKDGLVVKDEVYPKRPVIKILDDKIIEIFTSLAMQVKYVQFYDTDTGRVSPVYDTPAAIGKDKVAYMKDGVLVVTDMFDTSIFYKEIRRNFAQTAVPVTVISEAEFKDSGAFSFKYLDGQEFKAVTEVINLFEKEDKINTAEAGLPLTLNNETLVLKQNEPVNKEKLKRGNAVEADFLDIKRINKIADFKAADINGDKILDYIIAVSQDIQPVGSTMYFSNYKIMLQDGETKNISLLDSKFTDNLSGLGMSLLTGNFDDDMISDLFIYVNTGGNGGAGSHIYKIITFKGNKPVAILGETRESMRVDAKGKFEDGYIFLISYDPINYQYAVDVSLKKEKYKDLYSDGKVKVQGPYLLGSIEYFYELIPKDTDDDGVLELLGSQYISGYGRSDAIGTLRSLLKWDGVLQKYEVKKLFYTDDFIWDEDWYEIN